MQQTVEDQLVSERKLRQARCETLEKVTPPTQDDAYYLARVEMHTRYLQLDSEAWELVRRLNLARVNGGDYRRLTRIADRADRRWRRRRDVVRWLGMDEESVQRLATGDAVLWRGQTLTIADWTCHRDPVYGLNNRRIWAEPQFVNAAGRSVYVAPIYWHEMM